MGVFLFSSILILLFGEAARHGHNMVDWAVALKLNQSIYLSIYHTILTDNNLIVWWTIPLLHSKNQYYVMKKREVSVMKERG